MNRSDLKFYKPDRWYYVQYGNGRELSQIGFSKKELADSFAQAVAEVVESHIKSGAKRMAGMEDKVVEAKGWKVGNREFSDYHEALWYKWNNEPIEIKGVF